MKELDNIGQIESEGSKGGNLNLSNIYSARLGGFGIDKQIRTYLTTLTVQELENDVSFYETLSNDKDWPISQIVQREVDQDRVNSIAKKYLLGTGRIVKYFPPIIVALLPRNSDGTFSDKFIFTPDETDASKELIFDKSKYRSNTAFKKVLSDKKNESKVDGIYFLNVSPVFEHNLFAWDKSKFYAVVIDGQHRLEALIRSRKEDGSYGNAQQDVVFLDVSHFVFSQPSHTPVEVLRTIFIDINTNAKSVGLVRRILMDDKDLASLCVQSLVESVDEHGNSKSPESFIPSMMIDWDGNSLKHELPHITGILTLYQIIADEVATDRLVTIDDHRDQRKIKNFIELLNNYFFVDHSIKTNGELSDITTLEESFKKYLSDKTMNRETFSEQLDDEGLDSILFNYDYRTLKVAQINFENLYLKAIIEIFINFRPYEEAIKILKDLNAFDSKSTLYKALLASKSKLKSLGNGNLKDAFAGAKQDLNDKVNQKYFLFYSVVGQKGIYRSFFEKLFNDFKYGINEESIIRIEKNYILEINKAIDALSQGNFYLFGKSEIDISISDKSKKFEEYGTIASSFWEGILYEDKRIIYNSQGVRAFSDVIKFVLDSIANIEQGKDKKEMDEYIFRFSEQRTKRLLKKRFSNRPESEYEEKAKEILNFKKTFLFEKISSLVKKA